MNRETIYKALFTKLEAIAGFKTISRRLLHWSEVTASEQPALFQVQTGETLTVSRGVPPKYQMAVELFLYANTGDAGHDDPSTILNPLIDAIETALEPDPTTGYQTLGLSNVSHCWIEGRIETSEGALGGQGVVIIPISIIATR